MNLVQMAAQLYDARDTAKRLLGDKFQKTMTEFGSVIDVVAKGKDIEPIAAMTLIAQTAMVDNKPMHALYVMAALVELVEPEPTNG